MNRKTLLAMDMPKYKVPPFLPDDDVVEDVLADDGKTLVKTIVRKSADPLAIKKQSASDFSLQNLAAVGAIDSLRPSFIKDDNLSMNPSSLESIERLSDYYDKVSNLSTKSDSVSTAAADNSSSDE